MSTIKIEIISDTVCLWCYLGHKRLQKAIKLYQKTYPGRSKDEFKLAWKPYILDPNPNPVGDSVSVHGNRMLKKMTPERAAQVQTHLVRLGTGEGIAFKFGGKVASPLPSRQLLYLAGLKGSVIQTGVAEELFRALWECEEDISRVETLVEVGALGGLDIDEVRMALKGVELKKWKENRETPKRRGLTGCRITWSAERSIWTVRWIWVTFFDALVKVKDGKG